MKKLLLMAALSLCASVQAVTVIRHDGTVYQTAPPVQNHYHNYNYTPPQPAYQSNSMAARYYRGEISSQQYIDSMGIPKNETYDVQYRGNGRYSVRKGY